MKSLVEKPSVPAGGASVPAGGVNGTYSRYGFIVGEFPSPGVTAGRTDRPSVRPCIVSGRVGEEERPSSGEKAPIKAFLTRWKH